MRRTLLKITVFLSALLLSGFVYADTAKTIKFGTDASYPPFESINPQGKIVGFDIDVINAICQKIKAQCVFTNEVWDSLIPAVQLGKFDGMFGAMNITKQREKQIDFTAPYYHNKASIVALRNADLALTKAGLQGKTIGVLSGATFGPYLQNTYGSDVKINDYASEESAFLDLTAGRIDAVMGDTPLIMQWIKHNGAGNYVAVGQPISDERYFGMGYGIAVRKGNTQLLQKLNSALDTLKKNGELAQIEQKYFGS